MIQSIQRLTDMGWTGRRWYTACSTFRMAHTYKELSVWQLADELRHHIVRITAAGGGAADRDFARDIRRSARSVPANVAEGFGRFDPPDFHRFLKIAKASLDETENHLADGLASGIFASAEHAAAQTLVKRTTAQLTSLMRYLRTVEAKQKAAALTRRTS